MHSRIANSDIKLYDLLRFLDNARKDLEASDEFDAAHRFEILRDKLKEEYKGGTLVYTPKLIGL